MRMLLYTVVLTLDSEDRGFTSGFFLDSSPQGALQQALRDLLRPGEDAEQAEVFAGWHEDLLPKVEE